MGVLLIKNIHLIRLGFTTFIKDCKNSQVTYCEEVTKDLKYPIINWVLACIYFSALISVFQPETLHKHIVTFVEAAVIEQCACEGVLPRTQKKHQKKCFITLFLNAKIAPLSQLMHSISPWSFHFIVSSFEDRLVCSNSGNSALNSIVWHRCIPIISPNHPLQTLVLQLSSLY